MTLNHYPRIYTTQDISRMLTMAWLLYRKDEAAKQVIEKLATLFDATLQIDENDGGVVYKEPCEAWIRISSYLRQLYLCSP